MIDYSKVLSDIEQLKGRRLKSIKDGADLVIDDVDYEHENVAVHSADDESRRNSRPFREFRTIWDRLVEVGYTENPWVSVEEALAGSGSSRNQPETIMANLPYIVWGRPNNRKCIAYVGSKVHKPAEIKRAEDSDFAAMRSAQEYGYLKSLESLPFNWVFFGAPGTGKSYELNRLAEKCFPEGNISRVTFYPDLTYSQFVGCFKPMTESVNAGDGLKETTITYRYVFGPFLRTYVEACKHPRQNYLLIVEEINRANPAAVFGDVFQLLDRDENGRSEYPVDTPEEMRNQLACAFGESDTNVDKLVIPQNMYIWATMNSADQGVFPMDTAFKRRWDFRYMGINDGENAVVNGIPLSEITVPCGGREVVWNKLRRAINQFMLSDEIRVNEDKLLGPFFIAPSSLVKERFPQVFKDKVLLYLYEDAGKMRRSRMFRPELKTYSEICGYFDKHGDGVFGEGFDDYLIFEVEGNESAHGSEV